MSVKPFRTGVYYIPLMSGIFGYTCAKCGLLAHQIMKSNLKCVFYGLSSLLVIFISCYGKSEELKDSTVNEKGVVNFEIEQEESNAVETETSGIDSPTISQRKLRTTVVVNSGETVALGGLIRETLQDSVSGIPILSSIPFLGKLFSSTSESRVRTELLVLITPRVIRNQAEARAVTSDLRKTLHNAAALTTVRK